MTITNCPNGHGLLQIVELPGKKEYKCTKCYYSYVEVEKTQSKAEESTMEKRSKAEISKMLKDVSGNDDLRIKFVEFLNKFHNYSFGNILWLMFQANFSGIELSHVRGKKQWLDEFKRSLKNDAVPFNILAPRIWKKELNEIDPLTEKKKVLTRLYFNVVQVYDYSQTDGEPIQFPSYRELKCENPEQKLKEFTEKISKKYPVEFISMNIQTGGNTDSEKIRINNLRPIDSQLYTLLHEYGHAILEHVKKRDKVTVQEREVEAELTAFLVATKLGIPRGSEDYINQYGGLTEESVMVAVNTAQKVCKDLGI